MDEGPDHKWRFQTSGSPGKSISSKTGNHISGGIYDNPALSDAYPGYGHQAKRDPWGRIKRGQKSTKKEEMLRKKHFLFCMSIVR